MQTVAVGIERKRQIKCRRQVKDVGDSTKAPSLGVEGIPSTEVGSIINNTYYLS